MPLGPLETVVLEALWVSDPLSPRELHAQFGVPRSLAYTTVLTVLQRLHRKGFVDRVEEGRTHRYAPRVDRDTFESGEAQRLAADLVRIGDSGVAAFLSEARRLDPAMVEKLRQHLDEQR